MPNEMALEGLAHKPKPPKKVKDMRKHGIAETHIKHNHDGTHHVTHHYIHPGMEPSTHGVEHMEHLHDHLEEMLGGKPTKEELAEHEESETPAEEKAESPAFQRMERRMGVEKH